MIHFVKVRNLSQYKAYKNFFDFNYKHFIEICSKSFVISFASIN